MARLAISREFLPEYARLDRAVQVKVEDVFVKFAEHTQAGLHLEKMRGAIDPRVRTVRIDDHYRGIVMAPDAGDTYLLVHVLTHDQSDKWVGRHRFGVNASTGALEVLDPVAIEEVGAALDRSELQPEPPLFADRQLKDFARLGVPEALVPLLRRITTAAELDGVAAVLPPGQGDALQMLAAGYSIEDAWAELVAGEDPGAVDQDDVDAALARPTSQSMFYVVHGGDALVDVLSRPFDLWRIFLHPSQKRLAYHGLYGGPALVTGGAGTGKTVVAMHRAKFLADLDDGGPILFTTFTRNLAAAIARDLRTLGGERLASRVNVLNIDRLAYGVVRDSEHRHPKLADDNEQLSIWQDVADEVGNRFPTSFLRREWSHVILGQDIRSRDEYFAAPRQGRGIRLGRRQRAEVWNAVNQFTGRLAELGARTHLQLAADAADILAAGSTQPYAHIVVDEAQDLHPAQWRMLRAAVSEGPDDLFIVGDAHQRIYDRRISLSSVGINVRGRARRLRLNYRTTYEILRWSLGLLTGEQFDDLDDGTDTLAGYHSQLNGPEPALVGYTSRTAELDGLVEVIRAWQARGVAFGDIGITARTRDVVRAAAGALGDAGIPSHILSADVAEPAHAEKVWLATMHGMKGLEFRYLAVLDVGQGHVPLPTAITLADEDLVEHDYDLQRERCLLFVAATRSRDELRISWTAQPSSFLSPYL